MKFEVGQQVFFVANDLLWRGFIEHGESDVITVTATYPTEEGRVYRTFNVNPRLVFGVSSEVTRFLFNNLNNPFVLQS